MGGKICSKLEFNLVLQLGHCEYCVQHGPQHICSLEEEGRKAWAKSILVIPKNTAGSLNTIKISVFSSQES